MSSNIFALLGDDDEGENQIPTKALAEAKKPAAKPIVQQKPSEGAKPPAVAPGRGNYGGRGRGSDGDTRGRGGRGAGRGGRGDRPPREDGESYDRENGGGRGGRGRGRGEGRGRGRGRDGDDNEERPRKREYERRSGSARGDRLGYETKRGGAGKGNWGKEGEEGQAGDVEPVTPAKDKDATDAEGADKEADKLQEPEKEREPEEKLMGLDDYLKIREENRAAMAVAAKGKVVKSDFSGMQAMEKQNEEDMLSEIQMVSNLKLKEKKVKEKAPKAQQIKDVGFKVSTPDERPSPRAPRDDGAGRGRGRGGDFGGRGGRGGRGEGFGRGGRGGGPERSFTPRGPSAGRSAPPKMDDSSAFPTLGA